MKTYNNGLKKIIKRLPNQGNRSGWVAKVQDIIKSKKAPEVSNSLLYALVNDHAAISTQNMYLVEIIIQAVNELEADFVRTKSLIEDFA